MLSSCNNCFIWTQFNSCSIPSKKTGADKAILSARQNEHKWFQKFFSTDYLRRSNSWEAIYFHFNSRHKWSAWLITRTRKTKERRQFTKNGCLSLGKIYHEIGKLEGVNFVTSCLSRTQFRSQLVTLYLGCVEKGWQNEEESGWRRIPSNICRPHPVVCTL